MQSFHSSLFVEMSSVITNHLLQCHILIRGAVIQFDIFKTEGGRATFIGTDSSLLPCWTMLLVSCHDASYISVAKY